MPILIQLYADKFRNEDLQTTLSQLQDDLNLPRPKTYDFIIGKCYTDILVIVKL